MTELFNTLTPYLTIIGIVAGLVLAFFRISGSKGDFLRWTQRNSIAERYHALLRWLLRRAEHLYDSRWLSWQAFAFSLVLAYLYPVLAALLGYALANNTQVAGLKLFDAQDNALLRWLVLLALLAMIVLTIRIWLNYQRINARYDSLSQRLFGSRLPGRLLLALVVAAALLLYRYYASGGIDWTDFAVAGAGAGAVTVAVAGAVAFAIVAALVGAFTLAFAVAFADAVASTFAFAFAFALAFALAFAVAVAVAVAVTFAAAVAATVALAVVSVISSYLRGYYADAQAVLLLYLMLPLINALFDCVSVKYSRYFSTRIAAGEGTGMVSKHLLLDAILALLFFFGLLLALPPLIDGYNWLCSFTSLPPINWRELALQARDDPWGAGILVTLMLLSTLIPTLLHLLMAGLALGGRGLFLGYFARGMQQNSMYVFGLAIWAGILTVLALAACHWTIRAFIALFNLDITGKLYNLLMLVYANGWQYAVLVLVSIVLLTLMRWRLESAEQICAKAQARSAT